MLSEATSTHQTSERSLDGWPLTELNAEVVSVEETGLWQWGISAAQRLVAECWKPVNLGTPLPTGVLTGMRAQKQEEDERGFRRLRAPDARTVVVQAAVVTGL